MTAMDRELPPACDNGCPLTRIRRSIAARLLSANPSHRQNVRFSRQQRGSTGSSPPFAVIQLQVVAAELTVAMLPARTSSGNSATADGISGTPYRRDPSPPIKSGPPHKRRR